MSIRQQCNKNLEKICEKVSSEDKRGMILLNRLAKIKEGNEERRLGEEKKVFK